VNSKPPALRVVVYFQIPESGRVTLRIINTLGQIVQMILDEDRNAGTYTIEWNGKNQHGLDVPSGVYFYSLHFGGKTLVKKMTLLR